MEEPFFLPFCYYRARIDFLFEDSRLVLSRLHLAEGWVLRPSDRCRRHHRGPGGAWWRGRPPPGASSHIGNWDSRCFLKASEHQQQGHAQTKVQLLRCISPAFANENSCTRVSPCSAAQEHDGVSPGEQQASLGQVFGARDQGRWMKRQMALLGLIQLNIS